MNNEKKETVPILIKEPDEKLFNESDLRTAYNYGMFAVTSGRSFKDWFANYKSK